MNDFIRPNFNQEPETIKPKKKSHVKETVFIICMIVCLGIGFVCGYITNRTVPDVITGNDGLSLIEEVYNTLNDNWYNASGEDIDIQGNSIAAMVASLKDIHNEYYSQEEAQAFNQSVDGNYSGIGVLQRTVSQGTIIIKIYQNTPAYKSDLQVGDIITEVDGQSVAGMSASEISDLVRGEANSNVNLTIIRQNQQLQVTVTRENIDSSVYYEIRNNNGKDYGYLQITTFGSTTGEDVAAALSVFSQQHIDTLVLDLRDNGGGYLIAAQDVLSLFFDEGELMFQMESKNGQVDRYEATNSPTYNFVSGYILVNNATASASEVVAGALQAEKNYKLIGNQTYGKGTAQTQKQLSDGSVLKYTYARWLLPDGTWIDGEGLTPDYLVNNVDISNIAATSLDQDLTYDSVSMAVASLQQMLQCLGYPLDRSDGYFSSQTVAALTQFEQDHNLTVDGIYSDSDRQILEATLLIFANSEANDFQYQRLLELIQ